jgi:hypothetical protein
MHEIDIWSVPRGHQDDEGRKKKKMKEICTDWYQTNWSSVMKDNDLIERKRLSADITLFFFFYKWRSIARGQLDSTSQQLVRFPSRTQKKNEGN